MKPPNAKNRIIDPNIKLSVHVITYNQEKYIRQALQGVVEQQVNFRFEVVIGDDFSTDGTREIVQEFATKYPEIIRPLFHPCNLGPKGIEGKYNFITTFYACKGLYMALLDGDDYWNDKHKLQKQVDFLETNPDYSICFHRVYEKSENGISDVCVSNFPPIESTYTIEDLAKRNMIYTASVVFKNHLFQEFPEWFMESPVGDYMLHLLNAKKGKIKYFPEPMATYRTHGSSVWSSLNEHERYKKWIITLKLLLKGDFSDHVLHLLKQQFLLTTEHCFHHLLMANKYERFSIELKQHLKEFPERTDKWLFEIFPGFYKTIIESKTYRLSNKIAAIVRKLKIIFRIQNSR